MNKLLGGTLGSLFLMALLAACGGGPGTKVTATVVNYDGTPGVVTTAAYQVGGGAWQTLNPDEDGRLVFYVPSGETRYGVAVRCGGLLLLGNYSVNAAAQLTTAESTAPVLGCMSVGPFAEVSGHIDVSGVTGAAGYEIEGAFGGDSGSTTADDCGLDLPLGPDRDLVAFAKNASGQALAAKVVRGIDARAPVALADLALTDADAVEVRNVGAFTVPGGWNGNYELNLYTAGGATVLDEDLLGSGTETGGAVYTVKNAQSGDLYQLMISASAGASGLKVARFRFVDAPEMGDVVESLSIDPFLSYAVAAAAHPVFPATHPDEDVQAYMFTTISPVNVWSYTVSRGWLGNASEYATPDLSGLRGFAYTYPLNGEGVSWFAIALKTNGTARELFELPRASIFLFSLPKKAGLVIDAASVRGNFTAP